MESFDASSPTLSLTTPQQSKPVPSHSASGGALSTSLGVDRRHSSVPSERRQSKQHESPKQYSLDRSEHPEKRSQGPFADSGRRDGFNFDLNAEPSEELDLTDDQTERQDLWKKECLMITQLELHIPLCHQERTLSQYKDRTEV
ncbi:hypothetical protein PtA15_11A136 [Puccinia triticina]|uniref:Uncharacterized protein n=1 Tax=Puccinia triticina TaxID=208348 RepID=A0ABY7CWZ1_9BASI|nr:uncharacterized protein PtA15_11A136 [Puccinia triticina]WAQ89448.1 hypothetical protein PtA15_11A136 [Puccinia triticina]